MSLLTFLPTLFPCAYSKSNETYWDGKLPKYKGDLQVIGAGFGRTGTFALQKALELLYEAPCYHGSQNIARDDIDFWTRACRGEHVNYSQILHGFAATVDYPSCCVWKELAHEYPHAKIILTVRDAEKWYQSVSQTVFTHLKESPFMNFGSWILFTFHPFWRRFATMHSLNCDIFHKDFSKENIMSTFCQWNQSVVRDCPPDRLLVFDVSEGWEPLCKFLGKPVPNVPFPHMNDSTSYQTRVVQTCDRVGYFMLAAALVSTTQ